METVKERLQQLTQKKNIYLVSSGNNALKQVVSLHKEKTFLIQDQGGWITYKQFPKKYIEVKTNYGLTQLYELISKVSNDKTFLVNSMPGYFQIEDMDSIINICKNKCLVINDVSGSLGKKQAGYGDIVVGSFGKDKAVNLGYGGFIASDSNLEIEETFDNSYLEQLNEKIKKLKKRLNSIEKKIEKIKEDLKKFKLINKQGLNIAVIYNTEEEKQSIINYCKDKYEYVECPKYIKILEKAISIEVKRISF